MYGRRRIPSVSHLESGGTDALDTAVKRSDSLGSERDSPLEGRASSSSSSVSPSSSADTTSEASTSPLIGHKRRSSHDHDTTSHGGGELLAHRRDVVGYFGRNSGNLVSRSAGASRESLLELQYILDGFKEGASETVVRDSLEKLLRFLMKEENLGTLRNHGSWGLVFDTLEALVTTQDKMDATLAKTISLIGGVASHHGKTPSAVLGDSGVSLLCDILADLHPDSPDLPTPATNGRKETTEGDTSITPAQENTSSPPLLQKSVSSATLRRRKRRRTAAVSSPSAAPQTELSERPEPKKSELNLSDWQDRVLQSHEALHTEWTQVRPKKEEGRQHRDGKEKGKTPLLYRGFPRTAALALATFCRSAENMVSMTSLSATPKARLCLMQISAVPLYRVGWILSHLFDDHHDSQRTAIEGTEAAELGSDSPSPETLDELFREYPKTQNWGEQTVSGDLDWLLCSLKLLETVSVGNREAQRAMATLRVATQQPQGLQEGISVFSGPPLGWLETEGAFLRRENSSPLLQRSVSSPLSPVKPIFQRSFSKEDMSSPKRQLEKERRKEKKQNRQSRDSSSIPSSGSSGGSLEPILEQSASLPLVAETMVSPRSSFFQHSATLLDRSQSAPEIPDVFQASLDPYGSDSESSEPEPAPAKPSSGRTEEVESEIGKAKELLLPDLSVFRRSSRGGEADASSASSSSAAAERGQSEHIWMAYVVHFLSGCSEMFQRMDPFSAKASDSSILSSLKWICSSLVRTLINLTHHNSAGVELLMIPQRHLWNCKPSGGSQIGVSSPVSPISPLSTSSSSASQRIFSFGASDEAGVVQEERMNFSGMSVVVKLFRLAFDSWSKQSSRSTSSAAAATPATGDALESTNDDSSNAAGDSEAFNLLSATAAVLINSVEEQENCPVNILDLDAQPMDDDGQEHSSWNRTSLLEYLLSIFNRCHVLATTLHNQPKGLESKVIMGYVGLILGFTARHSPPQFGIITNRLPENKLSTLIFSLEEFLQLQSDAGVLTDASLTTVLELVNFLKRKANPNLRNLELELTIDEN